MLIRISYRLEQMYSDEDKSLNDFQQSDCLMGFIFLRKKDVEKEALQHSSARYKVVAIHPDKSNERYHMLLTYVMPCDELIDWIRKTKYRVVSIRKSEIQLRYR